ncbi:CHAP domain-containing protein [Nanchangia anserum]|uniref:CHAP domain-containing protein n=1 Tax=Nanchangia anserum TaxID=2692125 RepID=A0A8I0KQE2_9ACTO|nr:CHAP domain-containing protein [Nanchangia anserum]MBD3689885.1 CHAP domain-containing protein [Nanchangia anserum]QOX82055.1 CHAP domain-containing protein [Nanchangia anserum]
MAPTAQQVLNLAASEVGYSRWSDPATGTKYGRWYAERVGVPYFGANGVPYCAMFTSYVLVKSGIMPPGGIFAYVPSGINQARRAGRLVPVASAQPGDLIPFDWNGDGIADHIGFFVRWVRAGVMETIEGNTSTGAAGSQSNGGVVARRVRSTAQACGAIRPAYAAAAAPASTGSSGKPARLVVDGVGGALTVTAAQAVYNTPRDGKITGQWQPNARFWPALTAVGYGSGGSTLVRTIQYWVKTTQDGLLGPDTIKALQSALSVPADGVMGAQTMKAWQTWLNQKLGY